MDKKTIIAVLAVLTIVFCGTTSYFYITYAKSQNDYRTLSDGYDALNEWLNGNRTLLQATINERDRIQTWLDDNKTLLQATIAERDQLQVWLDGNTTSYEFQIENLSQQIANLNSQIESLNTEITNLQSQIDTLETQIGELNNTIDNLQKAELGGYLNSTYTYYPLLDDEHHVQGVIINYGTDLATGVYVDMTWSVETGTHPETLPLPNIPGRSYVIIDNIYKFDLTDFLEEPEFQYIIHWDQET